MNLVAASELIATPRISALDQKPGRLPVSPVIDEAYLEETLTGSDLPLQRVGIFEA
jgi:hypothetical protein